MQSLKEKTQSKDTFFLNATTIFISILQVIGERFDIFALRMLKPIPILLLIYAIYKRDQSNNIVPKLIKYGLMISMAGDITLMFDGTTPFIIGTAIFLIAHLVYIVAFASGKKIRTLSPFYKGIRFIAYIVRLLILAFILYKIWDKIPSKIMFVTYGFILAVQNIATLARYQKTDNYSFYTIVIGSLLFTTCDTLIAIFTFEKINLVYGEMIIMSTYYAGQYLITQGAIEQGYVASENEEKKELKKQK